MICNTPLTLESLPVWKINYMIVLPVSLEEMTGLFSPGTQGETIENIKI